MEEKIYVVTHMDRTGSSDHPMDVMGVFTTREKACMAILDWVFEATVSDGEMIEGYEPEDYCDGERYVTNKSIWRLEEFEVDTVY